MGAPKLCLRGPPLARHAGAGCSPGLGCPGRLGLASRHGAQVRAPAAARRPAAPGHMLRALTPRKGKLLVRWLQLTALGPEDTMAMPTIAPTMECVLLTGISQ